MTPAESDAWRPELQGWSDDILPWYLERAKEIPDGAKIVEVGSFRGRSLIFLAEAFVQLGKFDVKIWGVDTWAWEPSDWCSILCSMSTRVSAPAANLIHLVRAESTRAARMFQAGELDMVFVDGEHVRPHPRQDICAWMPKVKTGGILAGHDYGGDWPDVPAAVDSILPSVKVEGTVWSCRM